MAVAAAEVAVCRIRRQKIEAMMALNACNL
jgi:hypothetical protein